MKLATILKKTNLNAIINNRNFTTDYSKYFTQHPIDELTYDKLFLTITLNGENIKLKRYVHTLVDDFKALIHNFWEYYRLLTQQNNFTILLTRDMNKLESDKENLNLRFKLFEERIKLDENEILTRKHKTIDSNKKVDKQQRVIKKIEATSQMYKRVKQQLERLKKKKGKEKKEIIEIENSLNKQQEDLKLNAQDLFNFYTDIIRQITIHMKKFRPNWNDFESKRLMTSLKLHIPAHTIDEKTGLAILIAPPNLNKLQNIGKLLYELEKKIVFLEETNNAEQNAKELIEAEAVAAAAKEATEEAAEKNRRKRREKKKRQKSRKKEREKKKEAEKELRLKEEAAKEVAAPAEPPPPPPPPPSAAGESKQDKDDIKKRITDIKSYLTKNKIPLKRVEDKKFIEQEKDIKQFIHLLNIKLPVSSYKLVITGGYAIRMHGGKNKTGDIDMVLCHQNDVRKARGFITTKIFEIMGENDMAMPKNNVLSFSQNSNPTDPTNPVKIRINGVQAIDITFKGKNDNFCKEVEVIEGFFVLKPNFMKRNLMEITNNFRQKLAEGVISHPGKLVSWRDQMTSLNKLLTPRSRTSSPTQGGVRKTRRRKKIKKRKKGRRKSKKKKK